MAAVLLVGAACLCAAGAIRAEDDPIPSVLRPGTETPPTGTWTREHFLPPRLHVHHLEAETLHAGDGWRRAGPVPLLTDLFGERVSHPEVRIRLAHDGDVLRLHARIPEPEPYSAPDRPLDSRRFWEQDHVEFRVLPDADDPGRQIQVIFVADGRAWDNQGWYATEKAIAVRHETDADGWTLEAAIPFAQLGVTPPRPGGEPASLRGLLAYTRWGEGWPDMACSTPARLGFAHAERYGEWILHPPAEAPAPHEAPPAETEEAADPGAAAGGEEWTEEASAAEPPPAAPPAEPVGIDPPVVLEAVRFDQADLQPGRNPGALVLRNLTDATLQGRLLMSPRDATGGGSRLWQVSLMPGKRTLRFEMTLQRPRMSHVRFQFEARGRVWELGGVTLRAGVADFEPAALGLRHPYLLLTPERQAELRRKGRRAVFRRLLPYGEIPERFFERHEKELARWERMEAPRVLWRDLRRKEWREVFGRIRRSAGKDPRRNAVARLRSILTPQEREALAAVEKKTKDRELLTAAAAAVNRLLEQPDLYAGAPEAFGVSEIDPEERAAFASLRDAEPAERIRRNRWLLHAVFRPALGSANLKLTGAPGKLVGRYAVTGDPRLVRLAHRYIAAADRLVALQPFIHLGEGNLSKNLAVAYDTFHPHLTEAERAVWRRVLGRFLRAHLRTARFWHWNATCIPNANPVTNGGGGLIALALLQEHPDAKESLQLARKFVRTFLEYCHGPDGGNTEGAQYWQYGTTNFVRFAFALEKTLGGDDGLLSDPAIVRLTNMIRVGLCNDGGMHGVNDTIPLPVGGELAWFAAGRFGDPLGLWYGDHAQRLYIARQAAGKNTPYEAQNIWAAVFRPDRPERRDAPPLPEAVLLPSIQYAAMRSAPRWDARWVVGVKGARPPYTHHNQADVGAFYAHLRGERLVMDPGYYRGRPKHHSLPLVDGRGPRVGTGFDGRVFRCDAVGDRRVLAVDATPAYEDAARRVRRWFVLAGEAGFVMLDDLLAADGAPGRIRAQFQAGQPAERLGGQAVRIRGERAALDLYVDPPAGSGATELRIHPERPLDDWGYVFSDCRHVPLTLDYTARAGAPLVAVGLDATDDAPGAPRVERTGRRITVRLPGGETVVFVRLRTGWIWDAPPPDREE